MVAALILSFIAGLADILGGFFSVAKKVPQQTLNYFIAISAGFILAVTFLDIYPEVLNGNQNGGILILIGFVLMFILENFFAIHAHCDDEKDHDHTLMGEECRGDNLQKHSIWAAFIGLLMHTFFDGAAIAARLLTSPVGGILVFIAVLSHKIPEGFAMSSIFQAGGEKRMRSFLAAVALGASTMIGALSVYLLGKTDYSLTFLGLAAGSFTYISCSELIPSISETKDKKGLWLFLLGVILFYLTSQFLINLGFKQ